MMTFGDALLALKEGKRVSRSGWNGKGMWLALQVPDLFSKMTTPYIYIDYPVDDMQTTGATGPWVASQTDMLAEDWEIVE